MNFKHNVIKYVIDIVTLCGKKWIELEIEKVPVKDEWETHAIIPVMKIVGVNHCVHILHMYRRMFHYYTTDETINQIAIGFIINPSLKFNNVFRIQI